MSTAKTFAYFVSSFLFLNILIGPLVVSFWYATWTLLDLYVLPSDTGASALITFSFGLFFQLLNVSAQMRVHNFLIDKPYKVFLFVSRLHTYFTACVSVSFWRGLWGLIDLHTGYSKTSAVSCVLLSVVFLMFIRALQSINTPPFVFALDTDRQDYFTIRTRFDTDVSVSWKFAGDVLFTTAIIYSLVVVFWRGVWTFLDNVLPTDPGQFIVWSFCLYAGIQVTFTALQYPIKKLLILLDRKSKILKCVLENSYTVFLGTGSVCFWRSIWEFLSSYYNPGNEYFAAWSIHILGYGMLVAILSSKSALPRGFAKDGETKNDQITSQELNATQIIMDFCTSAFTKKNSKTESDITIMEITIMEITHM